MKLGAFSAKIAKMSIFAHFGDFCRKCFRLHWIINFELGMIKTFWDRILKAYDPKFSFPKKNSKILALFVTFTVNCKKIEKSQKSSKIRKNCQKSIFSKVHNMTLYDVIWSEIDFWSVLKSFYVIFWYLNMYGTIFWKIDFLGIFAPKKT